MLYCTLRLTTYTYGDLKNWDTTRRTAEIQGCHQDCLTKNYFRDGLLKKKKQAKGGGSTMLR